MAQNFLPNFGQRTTGQSLRAVLSLVSFELSTIFTGAGGRKPTCTNWVRVSLFKIKLNFVPRQISVRFGQFRIRLRFAQAKNIWEHFSLVVKTFEAPFTVTGHTQADLLRDTSETSSCGMAFKLSLIHI